MLLSVKLKKKLCIPCIFIKFKNKLQTCTTFTNLFNNLQVLATKL